MVKLYIGKQEVDIDQQSDLSISLSVQALTDIEKGITGYSKTIRLPMSRRNVKTMGGVDQINNASMFNSIKRQARIEVDGFRIIEGAIQLIGCERNLSKVQQGWYLVRIVVDDRGWVKKASEEMFNEIEIPFEMNITGRSIENSWTWKEPVKFLPVFRNRPWMKSQESVLFVPARVLTAEDYHPFLHVKSLMEAIFKSAGYSINSQFMTTELFQSLYVSGNYPTTDTSLLSARMNFRAGRHDAVSAVANRYGCVYADPTRTLNTVGNIVQTASSVEQQNSKVIQGVFNTNNCFRMESSRVVFVPTQEIVLGFEYHMEYTSDYYIKSRTELTAFNSIHLAEQEPHVFQIVNRFEDRRANFTPNKQYMVLVFGYVVGNMFRFSYRQSGITKNVDFSDRKTSIVVLSGDITNVLLSVKSNNTYIPYTQDWAIYDQHVAEKGTIDVRVDLRSTTERVTPTMPKYFNQIFFGGAEQGMKITIGSGTTIKPIFSASPGVGSIVKFADVAAHRVRQIKLLNSVKHMFNLCLYTDEVAKEVFIEPKKEFYDSDTIVDWSDKIDSSKPIMVEELGADMSSKQKYIYQSDDQAVAKWNGVNGDNMGEWSAEIENEFAKENETIYQNQLFSPSLLTENEYPDAPAAMSIQVGKEKGSEVNETLLNFPAKIVSYQGLVKLPTGQLWGWPSFTTAYPLTAFHFKKDALNHLLPNLVRNGMTLCFEDRNGITGLHRYYDKDIKLYNQSRQIAIYLCLDAKEIEPFIRPNRLKRDFRAIYNLEIDGEQGLYILKEICDYNPSKAESTKCIFVKYQ